jgi:hypothetical protein
MSRKLKLALHQSAALAALPGPAPARTGDPTTTVILDEPPPFNLRRALLNNESWTPIAVAINAREDERRRRETLLEEEGCGALEHVPTDADYHGSGRWVDGQYVEDES